MPTAKYTDEQLDFLRAGCKWLGIGKLTAAFNSRFGLEKTEGQIHSAKKNHRILGGRGKKSGLRYRGLFNDEQAAFINKKYQRLSIAELTVAVNKKFNLTVKESQIRSFTRNHRITSGRSGRFVEGCLPWNAGTKGKGICKPNSGTFEKGNVPGNIKPFGDERICSKDGFILVKVAEANPYTGAPSRYKHKHVVVWERKNGPVPDGMVVRLLDGDKQNCSPENLLLVTRAEHLHLNRIGLNKYPGELRPTVLAIAKLEVKTFGKTRKMKKERANV